MMFLLLGHTLFHGYVWLFRSDLPNIIQVASGAVAVYALRKFNCKQPRCPRIGKHAVRGTTYKTCSKHATIDIHADLIARHKRERPDQHELMNQ